MKTRHKLALARAAYHVLHAGRALAGGSDEVVATRGGARYRLDLSQGVDFAVYLGCFERATAAAFARYVRPGATALDIGANIGAHTLRLAGLVGEGGKVHAFEPTDFAFRKLKGNLALNPDLMRRVEPVHAFLGTRTAGEPPSAIPSAWPLTGSADVHPKHLGESMVTAGAVTIRLDDYLLEQGRPRIDFVKLDVDGFECEVLGGAPQMLARDRPVFVMEIAPYVLVERGASLEQLVGLLAPHGYRFVTETGEKPLPATAAELAALVPEGASLNVVALPRRSG
jgi:FkbM family methyltransferase